MQLTAYPRIHVGLADMGFASQRAFGGVGFAIDHSTTVVDFAPTDVFQLSGVEQLDEVGRWDLHHIIDTMQKTSGVRPFHARILRHPPQHCGFGSKTSLALSLIAGANHFCGIGLSRQEMQILSGRGAASGVGIHAFFEGGVICDGGHQRHSARELLPSSARSTMELPPLLSRLEFPSQWRVILLLGSAPILSGDDEVAFFREHSPTEKQDALEAIATLHHGVLPAFATANYPALACALAELHSRGFKMHELLRCDAPTRSCFDALSRRGFPIGVSSVGPLLYAIVRKHERNTADQVCSEAAKWGLKVLGNAAGWNAGYNITDCPP